MANATIKVEGGPELRRALRELNGDLRDLTALHREIARDAVAAVSGTAPVDSGKLSGSFRARATRTTAKAVSSLIYAPIQNYGWPAHNIRGKHFAERALTSSVAASAMAKYRAGIEKLLRKAES